MLASSRIAKPAPATNITRKGTGIAREKPCSAPVLLWVVRLSCHKGGRLPIQNRSVAPWRKIAPFASQRTEARLVCPPNANAAAAASKPMTAAARLAPVLAPPDSEITTRENNIKVAEIAASPRVASTKGLTPENARPSPISSSPRKYSPVRSSAMPATIMDA